MSNYYYLDVSLDFGQIIGHEISPEYFKQYIINCVTKLFGIVAANIDIDILKYDSRNRRSILRVPKNYYVKVRSSLTLCGDCQGDPCAFRIHKASPSLLALQGDSRDYQH